MIHLALPVDVDRDYFMIWFSSRRRKLLVASYLSTNRSTLYMMIEHNEAPVGEVWAGSEALQVPG